MPWQIGIDEAGYGPNLGPLLQSAVGLRVADPTDDPWKLLAASVRRCRYSEDRRLIVDDSKKVFTGNNGLRRLELGVLALLCPAETRWPIPLGPFLHFLDPDALAVLLEEPWFDEHELLPLAVNTAELKLAARSFQDSLRSAKLMPLWVRCRITPPTTFNVLLDRLANKAEVLADGLQHLLAVSCCLDDTMDELHFAIDRQGGRIYQAPLLQAACPSSTIEILAENGSQSRYRATSGRPIEWSFEIEAESRHFTVAVASMLSKYLRELLMHQFNRFWQRHVPQLKPTAGYPMDAKRFLEEIYPAMRSLRIPHRMVWRRK